jgi:hypothetical protein
VDQAELRDSPELKPGLHEYRIRYRRDAGPFGLRVVLADEMGAERSPREDELWLPGSAESPVFRAYWETQRRLADIERPNLLANPGFEDLNADGSARSWEVEAWRGGTRCSHEITTHDPHEGVHAAHIVHEGRADSRFVQRFIPEPGHRYRLSGWIRSEGVGGERGGGYLSLEAHGLRLSSRRIAGTTGWTKRSVEVHVSRYLQPGAEMKAMCRLGDYGFPDEGNLFCDDLRLEKLD